MLYYLANGNFINNNKIIEHMESDKDNQIKKLKDNEIEKLKKIPFITQGDYRLEFTSNSGFRIRFVLGWENDKSNNGKLYLVRSSSIDNFNYKIDVEFVKFFESTGSLK